jgi:ribonuclease BN (tRNA processing enzyme)
MPGLLAFRLDSDAGSICYSGDSGLCDEIVELARRAGVGMLVLTHLLPELDAPDRQRQMLDAIAAVFDGQVVGEDLMRISLGDDGACLLAPLRG